MTETHQQNSKLRITAHYQVNETVLVHIQHDVDGQKNLVLELQLQVDGWKNLLVVVELQLQVSRWKNVLAVELEEDWAQPPHHQPPQSHPQSHHNPQYY